MLPSSLPRSPASRRQACEGEEKGKPGSESDELPQPVYLDHAARYLTTVLLRSPIGVVVTDSRGCFIFANGAYCAMTGYTERELHSLNWVSITHPEDRELNFEFVRRALEGESSFVVEKRYITRSGGTVWVRNTTFLMHDDAGDYSGAIVLAENISELKQEQEARRAMSARLLKLREEERRRIARELHDSTAQTLAGLLMILAPLKQQLSRLNPEVRRAVADGVALAKKAACEVRTFSYLLHPPLLDELGLLEALRCFVQGFRQRSRMEIKLMVPPSLPDMSEEVELALYRILQESLSNTRRHSGSLSALVCLRVIRGQVHLLVRDHGHVDAAKRRKRVPGVGIAGMHERVRQLDGRLKVVSGKRGTLVHALIPLTTSGHSPGAHRESQPARAATQ